MTSGIFVESTPACTNDLEDNPSLQETSRTNNEKAKAKACHENCI